MKKNLLVLLAVPALLAVMASCNKNEPVSGATGDVETPADETGFSPILLGAEGAGLSASVETKATAVTSLSSFYASATTGSAGSESSVWNSVTFTKDGATTDYKGDKWWPNSNPSYHFYASNAAITFAAAGSTVAATNATDVICAYMASPSYKAKNTLTFEHVFARLGDVEVSAADGYTISGVSITVTPKTGGTFNMRTGAGKTDGTGWSSLTTGTVTAIANATPGTKSNDIYLVPGTYTLTASWTATRGGYTEDIAGMTADVVLTGGKVNKITTTLGGNAEEVVFGVSINPWGAATTDVEFPTKGPFGGLWIAPANLSYDGTDFVINQNSYMNPATGETITITDTWKSSSYNSIKGKTAGSYYFTYIELGTYFDSRGASFTSSSGAIDNNGNKVSFDGHDNWRLPTMADWFTLTTGASPGVARPGSTVNGTTGAKYALINGISGVTNNGSAVMCLLLFPDDEIITGKALTGINNTTATTGFTESDLNSYLDQGCAVLMSGFPSSSTSWNPSYGVYWSSDEGKSLLYRAGQLNPQNTSIGKTGWASVRLVR